MNMPTVPDIERVRLPSASRLAALYGRANFADAFSVDLPANDPHDAESLAQHIFAQQPEWIAALLRARDMLVQPFGLKRAVDLRSMDGDRLNIFRVYERHADEIILGEDDAHLNFRVSVLVCPATQGRPRRLILTTLVFYNRLLGRAYIALIAPFHRMVVRATLRSARTVENPSARQR